MPVKNAGKYLEACLDSILNQSHQEWELLAINDHSDDDSKDILRRYVASDNRIKLMQNQGNGIINALRLAYSKSTGKFITRMDADDIMPPTKLALLLDQLTLNSKGSLAVGLVKYFSTTTLGDGYKAYESWLNNITTTKTNFIEIYKECSIPSPAWMLHREDLNRCGAFDSDVYPEDYDLAFRMRAAKLQICPTQKVVHLWRDHPERSSRTSDDYADNRFLSLKISHFIKSDHNLQCNLTLWGAGKKGKRIASLLLDSEINFDWVTNNEKKIGHNIFGKVLRSDLDVESFANQQIIIAVAQPASRKVIHQKLLSKNLRPNKDYFFFC